MPRNIPAAILTELDSTSLSIWYLLRITLKSGVVKAWCEGAADGLSYDGDTYEARLIESSQLQYAVATSQQVNFKVANVDGAVTTIDQSESFIGNKCELIEYFPDIAQGYVRWTGFADEISELTTMYAIIPAYSGYPTTRMDAPRRTIQTLCPWFFAGNNSAWVSKTDFEGAECPYQRTATIGFFTSLSSAVDGTSNPVVVNVNGLSGSRYFRNGDYLGIDSEILRVSSGGGTNALTCSRAQKSTAIAAHLSGSSVGFEDCQKGYESCKDHGMAGNNSADQWDDSGTPRNRNYFGGFPVITGQMIGKFRGAVPGLAKIKKLSTVDFSGNGSAYGAVLPLIYGRNRISDPILLLANAEGDFLLTLWAVGEGLLATNATDDAQTSPIEAYTDGGTPGSEQIFVNGARRHDPRAGFGVQVQNGQQDQQAPIFTGATAYNTDRLGMFGTAFIALRTSIKNNPTIDATNLAIGGEFEVRYGRVVRQYTTTSAYTRKATTNGAWVLLDFETSGRGLSIDIDRIDIQSYIDLAAYNSTSVASIVDGSSVSRWTFNGAIDTKRPASEIEAAICLSMYCLPPFIGLDGKYKIRHLKSETLTGLPLFSSTASSGRNILWDDEGSTLQKSRRSLLTIPNEIRANFVAYENSQWIKTQLVVGNEDAQKAVGTAVGDSSIRVISKSVDLLGVTTVDEAARIATLILRAGEFAKGGLDNNLTITFRSPYRDSADLDLGDIFEAEDDKLSASTERYFRVIDIQDDMEKTEEGFQIIRIVTATLHSNSIYDDTASSVYQGTRLDPPVSYDKEAPPVTAFTVVEAGAFDNNNRPTTRLTFNYTLPSPLENFGSVVIYRSRDSGGSPVGDWRFVAELFSAGETIEYEITGLTEHFVAMSKNIAGYEPHVDTKVAAGTNKYPRYSVLVDGLTDTLTAPASPQIYIGSNIVTLTWSPYTSTELKLFKSFRVYRNTVNNLGTATLIDTTDATVWNDPTVAASTVYYYWIKGLSILNVEGTATSALSTTSPDSAGVDTGVPTAPLIGSVRNLGSFNPNEYEWLIGITRPGGASSWGGIVETEIQITTDATFVSFPTGQSLNQTYTHKPPFTITFPVNAPGTYYFRARVKNAFGYGSYSTTLTRVTHISDNVSADTGIPDAPSSLAIIKKSGATNNQLAGNEFEVSFEIPATNTGSYWGYSVYLHDSSTLPTATTQETGTAGAIVSGTAVLTDVTKAWSVNAYAGKDLVVFDPTRQATETFDYEGLIILANIVSNTATTITFQTPVERQYRNLTGCEYYIVNKAAGHHFWEKLKFSTPAIINEGIIALTEERSSRTRKLKFASGLSTVYAWVALYNLYGEGKVGSPVSATFEGIVTGEIKLLNITTGLIAASAVTYDKISVSQLSAINADLGTITAGTVTAATLRTSASNPKVQMDGTSLKGINSGGTTVFEVDGNTLKCNLLQGIVAVGSATEVRSPDSVVGIFADGNSDQVLFQISGVDIFTAVAASVTLPTGSFRVTTDGQGVGRTNSGISFYDSTPRIEFYVGGVLKGEFDDTSHATNTNLKLYHNGSYKRVTVDGSGFLKV